MKKFYIIELFGGTNLVEKPWYSKNWSKVIRYKSVEMGYRLLKFFEKVYSLNGKIKFSNNDTNFFKVLRKNRYNIFDIVDVSDLVYNYEELLTSALIYSGLEELRFYKGEIRSTLDLIDNLIESKYVEVFNDDKFINKPQYLVNGDILVNDNGEIAVVINNKEIDQEVKEIDQVKEADQDKETEDPKNYKQIKKKL